MPWSHDRKKGFLVSNPLLFELFQMLSCSWAVGSKLWDKSCFWSYIEDGWRSLLSASVPEPWRFSLDWSFLSSMSNYYWVSMNFFIILSCFGFCERVPRYLWSDSFENTADEALIPETSRNEAWAIPSPQSVSRQFSVWLYSASLMIICDLNIRF